MFLTIVFAATFLQFASQIGDGRPNIDRSKINGINEKLKKDVKPTVPFEFPSQEEIERLIRENGFFLAVIKKLFELVYGILTAPFRWVYRVAEFFIAILKLAEESFRQMGSRR